MKPYQWMFLTVVGHDRPGIIAGVTAILFRYRCNLEDMSMTLLDGQFAMMTVFSAPSKLDVDQLKKDFKRFEDRTRLSCLVRKLGRVSSGGPKRHRGTDQYLVQAIGPDKTGIVYKISHVLAGAGLNITDLNSKVLKTGGGKPLYTLVLETDIPRRLKVRNLRKKLEKVSKELGVEIQLKRVESLTL